MTICMGVTHTYGDVDKASLAVAAWLQAQGIPKGSVVALMMPNVPQYLPTMIGILRAGYVCTPVNPLYTGRELRHQLNDSGAKAIFVVDNFAQALEQQPALDLLHSFPQIQGHGFDAGIAAQ